LYEHEFRTIYDGKPDPAAAHETQTVNGNPDPVVPTSQNCAQQLRIATADIESHIDQYLSRQLSGLISHTLGKILSQTAAELLGESRKLIANATEKPSFKELVKNALSETTYLTGLTDDDKNMFECGLDSVQLPGLVQHINVALDDLGVKTGPVTVKTVFNNPSVNQLAKVLGER
jgi:aryl carrier-like protein